MVCLRGSKTGNDTHPTLLFSPPACFRLGHRRKSPFLIPSSHFQFLFYAVPRPPTTDATRRWQRRQPTDWRIGRAGINPLPHSRISHSKCVGTISCIILSTQLNDPRGQIVIAAIELALSQPDCVIFKCVHYPNLIQNPPPPCAVQFNSV